MSYRKRNFLFGIMLGLFVVLAAKVHIDITGDYEGLYLLRGENGAWLEITDDVFPEDVDRFLGGYVLSDLKRVLSNTVCAEPIGACMRYEWNKTTGRGFIMTTYPDNSKLLICISRFKGDSHNRPSGAVIGGNLPPSDPDADLFDRNETGIAFHDGKRYYHIWCNANEGIIDESGRLMSPETWRYVDSRLLENSHRDVTVVSRHRLDINKEKVPLEIERYLLYEVGNSYVTLVTTITNAGSVDTVFSYIYGDEPWVGNYGTSAGDVGWLRDRLITTEMQVDTRLYDYAGFFDYGNERAGEQHVYTNKANFIEWSRQDPPDFVFFSNDFGKVAAPAETVPLSSHTNRVLALTWGRLLLRPHETFTFTIAVGMAGHDPLTGMPKKPDTGLNKS